MNFKSFKSEEKGKGHWRLNTSLLEEANYIRGLLEQKDDWLRAATTTNDPREKWEYLKYKIRQYSSDYGKQRAKDRRERECKLEETLKVLEELCDQVEPGTDEYTSTTNEIERVKGELKEIDDYKTQGLILRSRCQWHEKGEKSNKYFLTLESRNKTHKTMNKLQKEDGHYTVDPQEIRNMQAQFYQSLYRKKPVKDVQETKEYMSQITVPKLDQDERDSCEGQLTLEECEKVMKSFKNGKAPGNDGIPAKFYKKFWPVFGRYMVDSLNTSYVEGELTSSQKQAVISLIDKGKDRTLLKNWRPISLINVDSKIASKAIASRMVKVLPKLINDNQVGYVKGRNITENVRAIQDLLNYTKMKEIPGLIMMIDFEKAFDSLDWQFLDLVLQTFNFGPSIMKWVKTFYTGVSSCVINNGITSQYFPVERGVRQGDPLSPYLFILAVEVLACAVRQNKNINGIRIAESEIKFLQYADDTTGLLNDIKSAKLFLRTVEEFGNFSGLKLNKGKTEAMWIGSKRKNTTNPLEIAWPQKPIRLLGVYIGYDEKECNKLNVENKIIKSKGILNLWKMRKLTLMGRIQIVKTFIISQFLFVTSVIPLSNEQINKINNMTYRFIWNGGKDKIKRSTLVSKHECGGLNAPDIQKMIEVSRIQWVRRFLSPKYHVWKLFFELYIKESKMNLKWLLRANFDPLTVKECLPKFYYEVLNVWTKIGDCDP